MNGHQRISSPLVVLSLSLLCASSVFAVDTCQDRALAIQDKIAIAKQHQNKWKIAGLEKALHEVAAHCTDKSILKDLQHRQDKLQKKLAEKRAEINEAEVRVSRAQTQLDRPEKLVKAKRKLAKKLQDRDEIKQRLQVVQHELGK